MQMNLHGPLHNLLRQLDDVLNALTPPQYSHSVPALSGATVGQHMRHIIELFEELFDGYHSGTVNYDNRRRSMILENNITIARERLQAIIAQSHKQDKPLVLSGNYDTSDGQPVSVATNYLRELVYNIEHTVHHMALIRVAVREIPGIVLPTDFGVAASTLRYQQACVQ